MTSFDLRVLLILSCKDFPFSWQRIRGPHLMQSYPPRALDRRLQEDWARDAIEGPRVLMSLRVDFGPMG